MLRSVNISFVQTAALVHAEKHFPVKRWQLIAEFVAKCVPVLSKVSVPLMALGSQCLATIPTEFQCTPDMRNNSFALISRHHPELLSYAQHQAQCHFLIHLCQHSSQWCFFLTGLVVRLFILA